MTRQPAVGGRGYTLRGGELADRPGQPDVPVRDRIGVVADQPVDEVAQVEVGMMVGGLGGPDLVHQPQAGHEVLRQQPRVQPLLEHRPVGQTRSATSRSESFPMPAIMPMRGGEAEPDLLARPVLITHRVDSPGVGEQLDQGQPAPALVVFGGTPPAPADRRRHRAPGPSTASPSHSIASTIGGPPCRTEFVTSSLISRSASSRTSSACAEQPLPPGRRRGLPRATPSPHRQDELCAGGDRAHEASSGARGGTVVTFRRSAITLRVGFPAVVMHPHVWPRQIREGNTT